MKRTVSNLVTRIGARAVATACQAIVFLLIARSLGPAEFGVVVQVVAVGTVGGALAGFGFRIKALRLQADDKSLELASAMMLIRGGSTTALALALFLAFHVVFGHDLVLVLVGVSAVVGEQLADLASAILAGLGKQRAASIMLLAYRSPALILCIFLPSPYALGIGSIMGALGSVAYLIRYWKRPRDYWSPFRGIASYWSATIVSNLTQLDTVVIRLSMGYATVGIFGAANRLAGPLNIVNSSIVSALLPDLTNAKSHGSRAKTTRSLAIVSVCYGTLVVACAPVAGVLIERVLGSEFSGIRVIVYGIFVAAALSGVSQVLHSLLYSEGLSRAVAISITAGTFAYLILLWPLSASFGLWGIFTSMVIGQITILGVTVSLLRLRSHRQKSVVENDMRVSRNESR